MITMQEFMNRQPKHIAGLATPVSYYWGGGHYSKLDIGLESREDLGYLFRASCEVFDEGSVRCRIVFHIYQILKVTPCGVRIAIGAVRFDEQGNGFQKTRFVALPATKQFASKTQAEAISQLRYRNRKYIKILHSRLDDAECTRQMLISYYAENEIVPALGPNA